MKSPLNPKSLFGSARNLGLMKMIDRVRPGSAGLFDRRCHRLEHSLSGRGLVGSVVSTAVEHHDVGLVYVCQIGDALGVGR